MTKYNEELYRGERHWKEGEFDVFRSTHWSAPGCHNGCGLVYYVKDGVLDHVEGDPRAAFNQGRLCIRCLNQLEAIYGKDRIVHPMRRDPAKRGDNDAWEQCSWDEAYDLIEENVRRIQKDYGPESIVGLVGTGRDVNCQLALTCYIAFKTPNLACGFLTGDSCMLPRMAGTMITHGDCPVADMSQFSELRYDDPRYIWPEVCLIWGNNPIVSNGDGFFGHWIVDAMRRGGTKLVVVDPEVTWLAAHAEVLLQVRPATDAALAMAMINVVIGEDLYDHDFVEKWTYGFDELSERVKDWTPERAAEVCGIDAEDIRRAARLFGSARPATLQWGLATDAHANGVHEVHAIMALSALTGNLEAPGGMRMARLPWDMELSYSCGWKWLDPELQAKRLGNTMSPMHQFGVTACAQADCMLNAIETGDPYPIKMLYLEGTNPITNMGAEAPRVYEAMMKMDFNVVLDYVMTPTASAVCDLFLPIAMAAERTSIREWWAPTRACMPVVAPQGEARSDNQITIDLINRLNPELAHEVFHDITTEAELCQWQITYNSHNAPEGQTFADQVEKVTTWPQVEYYRHEKGLLRTDGKPGFNTATGRIELYSPAFASFGLDPLPKYEEPWESPVSSPEKFKEYPIVITTGHRSWEFFHSEGRNQETMRELHPGPLFDVNPETAEKYGIGEGDWCWIENGRGRCRQRAHLTPQMKPGVINAEHGWWFPETEAGAPNLFGVFDSNINNLTTQMAYGETGYGAPYKGFLCKIYRCTPENSAPTPTEVVAGGGWDYERITMSNHDEMVHPSESAR